jgi:hypothetical protein
MVREVVIVEDMTQIGVCHLQVCSMLSLIRSSDLLTIKWKSLYRFDTALFPDCLCDKQMPLNVWEHGKAVRDYHHSMKIHKERSGMIS